MSEIYLAGGCFWGLEKYIAGIHGVQSTEVGYANGMTENPSYDDVCYRDTGHAETVHIIYDREILSLEFLLELYYEAIDPIALNQQGGDVGIQYRTGIYYTKEEDKAVIENSISTLQKKYSHPIAIEIKKIENYYPAEEYHQKYLDKNPCGYCHISKNQFAKVAEASRLGKR